MAQDFEYKIFSQRELQERAFYLGPATAEGGGVTKSFDWTAQQDDKVLWTPFSGNRFIISHIIINASSACTVTIYDGVDSLPNRVYKAALAANQTDTVVYNMPRVSDKTDQILYITTSASGGFVTVWGWETGTATTTTSTSTTTSSSSSSSSSVSTSTSSSSSSSSTSSVSSSTSSSSSSSSSSSVSSSTSSSSSSSTSSSTSSVSTTSVSSSTSSTSSSSSSTSSVSSSTSSITQTVT